MVVDPVNNCEQLGGPSKILLTKLNVEVTNRGKLKVKIPEGPMFTVLVDSPLTLYVTTEFGVPVNNIEAKLPAQNIPEEEIVAIGKFTISIVNDSESGFVQDNSPSATTLTRV
jgi:hypothetical protein